MNREQYKRLFVIVAAAMLTLMTASLEGQPGAEGKSPAGKTGTDYDSLSLNMGDTLTCSERISLYRESGDNSDHLTAGGLLRQLISDCPDESEELYIDAEEMYRELYERTGELVYVDSMIMIITQRIYYFDNRLPNDLHKADILFDLAGDDPDYLSLCYNILAEVAESSPDQMDCRYFVRLATAAASLYAMGIIDSGELGYAFVTAMGTLDWRMESNPAGCMHAGDLENLETFYRTSGAMTCEGLGTLYAGKIDRNFRDTAFVGKVFAMLNEAGCGQSDLYYNVAVKMFANDRSAENAVRLAELNAARNNMDRAVSYFTEAYNRDTSRIVRSQVLIRVALMELERGRREEARNRAEHAFQLNNRNAGALMILADCYAGAELGNKFDNLATYWVAVDYLQAAVGIDPSLKAEADAKIRKYMQLYPTREDCFYRKILDEGVVYNVGGWVNEVTRVRFRKE